MSAEQILALLIQERDKLNRAIEVLHFTSYPERAAVAKKIAADPAAGLLQVDAGAHNRLSQFAERLGPRGQWFDLERPDEISLVSRPAVTSHATQRDLPLEESLHHSIRERGTGTRAGKCVIRISGMHWILIFNGPLCHDEFVVLPFRTVSEFPLILLICILRVAADRVENPLHIENYFGWGVRLILIWGMIRHALAGGVMKSVRTDCKRTRSVAIRRILHLLEG